MSKKSNAQISTKDHLWNSLMGEVRQHGKTLQVLEDTQSLLDDLIKTMGKTVEELEKIREMLDLQPDASIKEVSDRILTLTRNQKRGKKKKK